MMLGVVLWSNLADRKAVIWCEDQGDLAFWHCDAEADSAIGLFDAGDLVQFEMELCCSLRKAHNPRLVVEQGASHLPQALRDTTRNREASPHRGQVIPFARGADMHRPTVPFERERKKG
jgi:hypothetical protein